MLPNPEQHRTNLKWLSTALDSKWRGPLGIGIGWDGIVGMIPVVGDVVTTIASVYIVLAASQLGVPTSVLLRMAVNIVLDNLVSRIPVLGWLFDFMYQSNNKNLALIAEYEATPHRTVRNSRAVVFGIIAGILIVSTAIIAALGFLAVQIGEWILNAAR